MTVSDGVATCWRIIHRKLTGGGRRQWDRWLNRRTRSADIVIGKSRNTNLTRDAWRLRDWRGGLK